MVGSSSSSRSGAASSRRQSATRRRSPPDSVVDVGVGGRQPQRVHRDLERRVEVPGVCSVDALLQARELVGDVVGVVGGQRVEAVEQCAELGHALLDVAPHVLGRIELGLLLEQPDRRAGGELRVAAVLGVAPGHDPQQRRLARAVVAEHADLGSRQERQRHVLQHLPVRREDLGQAIHREDVLGRHGRARIGTGNRIRPAGVTAP